MAMLNSILKPEGKVTIGIGEAILVYFIYQHSLPPTADVRQGKPGDSDIETVRRQAAWKSFAMLGLILLITQDVDAFLIGGAALGGIDLMYKHANMVHPATGKIVPAGGAEPMGDESQFPLPDYADVNMEGQSG